MLTSTSTLAFLMATLVLANPIELTSKPILPAIPRDSPSHFHIDISHLRHHTEVKSETKPEESTAPLEAREDAAGPLVVVPIYSGVYMCAGSNWDDGCMWHLPTKNGGCNTFVFDHNGSFGPDDGLSCKLYEEEKCTGSSTGGIYFPGMAGDLTRHNKEMSGVRSYSCETRD